jgi:putative cardiolipin synthase
LISPYFVPGIGGMAPMAKYRYPLIEAGAAIFEMKHSPSFEAGHRFRRGSTHDSLHTKAAVIDGERVFVGSLSIDPRSA